MIDIHTHILPHMDDGAEDVAVAAAMLKEELAQGVDTVVLTSHYYGKRHSPAQYLAKREASFQALKPHIPDGMRMILGAEVHFTGMNTASFDALCQLAIEGTKCILLELPFRRSWSGGLLEGLERFINETGYQPIIAHVERYNEVLKRPAIVTRLVQMGCLIQVNADALTDKCARRFTLKLLKKGLVHCIGTDAHNVADRAPGMQKAKEDMEKAGFLPQWNRMQRIMKEAIGGGAGIR